MRTIIGLFCLLLSIQSIAQESKRIQELKEELNEVTSAKDKLKVLEKLWQITAYDDSQAAIEYSYQAIEIAEKADLKLKLARAYERLGIAYANISEYHKSNDAYLNAITLHKALNKPRFVSSLLMNQAINFKDNAQYDSAIHYMEESTKFMNKENYCCKDDTLLEINYNGIKATVYNEQGKYLSSLDNAIRAAELSKQINDSIQYADNLVLIGNNNGALNNHAIALNYLKEALEIYRINEDTYYESETARFIGALYAEIEPIEKDSATSYLTKSIQLAKAINIPLLEMQSLNQYAEYLLKIQDYNRAEDIFNQSQLITNKLQDNFSSSRIKLGLGLIKHKNGLQSDALELTKEALQLQQAIGLLEEQINAHEQLFKIYKSMNNYDAALDEHITFKKLSDSLYSQEKTKRFDELQASFDSEKKAAEIRFQSEKIKTLNAQAENDKLTKTLYGIGMVSFLLIAGLLYFGFKQRIKKSKIEREKQEEIYRQEIAFKKKELASQTLHLVQKNTFIQELKETLEKVKQSPELFKIEFRRLVMLLKKQNAEDKDWEVFKSYFSEVHNNFDHKIKSISEEVTEKEIRLASFLRMNLSTKEIASMLNVLPDSVLKSKYRLKKKLQLQKEEDLTQFLNTL